MTLLSPERRPPAPTRDVHALREAVHDLARQLVFVRTSAGPALAGDTLGPSSALGSGNLAAYVPALTPERLGDPTFRADHGLRIAYVTGAMANGIGSVAIVTAMSRAGMLGFFGAAGLSLSRIEAAIGELQHTLPEPRPLGRGTPPPLPNGRGPDSAPVGVDPLPSPHEPGLG